MSKAENPLMVAKTIYLGEVIASENPFFGKVSCLNYEEAELYAYLEMVKILAPGKIQLHKQLDKMQRLIQVLGEAKWKRDILTHLSARASQTRYRKPIDMATGLPKGELPPYKEEKEDE